MPSRNLSATALNNYPLHSPQSSMGGVIDRSVNRRGGFAPQARSPAAPGFGQSQTSASDGAFSDESGTTSARYSRGSMAPRARRVASSPAASAAEGSARRKATIAQLAGRRKFEVGDVYTPIDLSARERDKYPTIEKPPMRDVFDALGINPLDEYKNPAMLAEFMTSTGRLKPRTKTGLRPVNQRKLSKAVRRATGMGIMPTVYAHPELLQRDTPWRWQ